MFGGRVPRTTNPLFLLIKIVKVLCIPQLKKLEGMGNVELELENKDLVTRIPTPKLQRKPKAKSKLVNWTLAEGYHLSEYGRLSLNKGGVQIDIHPKLEDTLDANITVDKLDSKQKMEDFVSKELDNFLQIQEKIKLLESLSIEHQTNEHFGELSMLRKKLEKKKLKYLGFSKPVKNKVDFKLPRAQNLSTLDKAGTSNLGSADTTKDKEERVLLAEKPIQKTTQAL